MPGEQSVQKELSSKRKLLINSGQTKDSDFRRCNMCDFRLCNTDSKLLNVTVKRQEVVVVLIHLLC